MLEDCKRATLKLNIAQEFLTISFCLFTRIKYTRFLCVLDFFSQQNNRHCRGPP